MAGLFGDQGQQQQLQVVRRQLASARQAAVVGKTEAAWSSATARMPAVAAMAVSWRESGVIVMVAVMVAVMMIVMMMVMDVVWHGRPYIVRYILRYMKWLVPSTIIPYA
jgi:hypothetical protein